jgi:hypothetical protein
MLDPDAAADLMVIGQQVRLPRVAALSRRSSGAHVVQSVALIFDGSRSAHRAAQVACELAERSRQTLVPLVVSPAPGESAEQLWSWFHQRAVRAALAPIARASPGTIASQIRNCSASALVINRDADLLGDVHFRQLVNELECPVILC